MTIGTSENVSIELTNKIRLFGLGASGNIDNVRPLRISTMQEMLLIEASMRGTSGLRRDQFAQNPWGFPFIPFPQHANLFNGHHRVMIEEGTSLNIGQHPIFWIDESLTMPTQDEENDPARWCVRMFYLIMGFGLWNENLQWISAPCLSLKVQSVSHVEYENYLKGFESVLSDVHFTEDDLVIPLDAINSAAAEAVQKCERLQRNAWTAYRTEQLAAYKYSLRLINDLDFTPWAEISLRLQEISAEIGQASYDRKIVSKYVDPLFGIIGDIVNLFNDLESNIVILSAVSLRSHSANVTEYNRIANTIQQFQAGIAESGYESLLQEAANRMINEADDNSAPEHFAELYEKAEQIYLNTERRVRLQTVNFARILNDQEPFASYTEMEIIQSVEGNIGQDNLPDVESISSRY